MISRYFNVLQGEMFEVLQCLRYILEMTVETPEKDGEDENDIDDLSNPAVDPYDNDYVDDNDNDEMYIDC